MSVDINGIVTKTVNQLVKDNEETVKQIITIILSPYVEYIKYGVITLFIILLIIIFIELIILYKIRKLKY